MGNLMGHPPGYFRPDRVVKRKKSESGQMWAEVAIVLLVLLIVAILVGGVLEVFTPVGCDALTRDLIYPHRWSLMGGCQIQTSDGWVPLDNYHYQGGPGG